jgi:hypothetical protein
MRVRAVVTLVPALTGGERYKQTCIFRCFADRFYYGYHFSQQRRVNAAEFMVESDEGLLHE